MKSPYFKAIQEKIASEIATFSNEKIVMSDFDQWIEYYYQKYYAEELSLFESYKVTEADESTLTDYNPFFSNSSYEKQTVEVPAYKFTIKIPFSGNSELLSLKPSTFYLLRFPATLIRGKNGDLDQISIELEFRKSEIRNKEDLASFVEKQFGNEFKHYRDTIINVNSDAHAFNASLKQYIRSCLEKRKSRANDFIAVCEKLNIPMKGSDNAPNTIPIPLKKIPKQLPTVPQIKRLEPEYGISDSDYQNIENIVDMYCTSCEKVASTFSKIDEEGIRDAIVSALNTHYTNVTGESFRKEGKTDILIEFNGKAGYIAECKIWHGIQALEDALIQLNGYMTWRDYKVSLILFNKKNANFSQVRANIDSWVKKNASSVKHNAANIWNCIVKRSDGDESYELSIFVYDFFIAN